MCQSPGQGQPGGTMPMRMDQLGDRQAQLNDRTRTLGQRLTEQTRLTAGDQDELRRLAQDQARIHDELRQIEQEERQRRQLLGRLDQTAEEMKQVEEALRQGQLGDELEQKQQHILSRLLDAQRSVNRQDFEPRRESRPGEDAARGRAAGAAGRDAARERPAAARPAQGPVRPLSLAVPRVHRGLPARAERRERPMTARPPRWLRALARVAGAVALAAAPAGPAAAQAFDSTTVEWHVPDLESREYGIRRIAPGLLIVGAAGEIERARRAGVPSRRSPPPRPPACARRRRCA